MSGEITAAFERLLFKYEYPAITVRQICEEAGVARSTFYECFKGKNDILRHSIEPLFAVLRVCASQKHAPDALPRLLAHMRENAATGLALLNGSSRPLLISFLAYDIRISGPRRSPFVARVIAAAQIAMLEVWLETPSPADVQAFARLFFETSAAIARNAL